MTAETIDFTELIEHIQADKAGADQFSSWGGDCAEAELLELLKSWPNLNDMPYRIWEYTNSIKLERNSEPDHARWLERGRLFGEGGDLSLRRDGDRFLWHFVGRPDVTKLPTTGNPRNFWETGSNVKFHKNEETALLWGRYDADLKRWFDDRAAKADLTYPVAKDWNRVQVNYWTFSRAGRVEFVWFYGLEAYNG